MPPDFQDVDLVTITFEGDVRLAALQILSVDRLLDHANIGRYIVILNGADNAAIESFLRSSLDGRISPELAAKIEYVGASVIMPDYDPQGWHGQQLLKLVVVNHLSSRFYLVLDAKNHFVHRTLVSDFFTATGIKTMRRGAPNSHHGYIRASFEAFGIGDRAEDFFDSTMPTITPYMMDASLVRAMMADIESRHDGRPFEDLFVNELRKATEFFLYTAYLIASGQDGLYETCDPMAATLFTKSPRKHGDVMRVLESVRSDRIAMFGLHRRRLPQLNREQREAIVKMWSAKLLTADENPAWFMEADAPLVSA